MPSYQRIHDILREKLLGGDIPVGLVLLEGPISELFGTSRGPVRKALQLLHDNQLISRFSGRGYLASPDPHAVEPLRDDLTADMLGLVNTPSTALSVADRIFQEVDEAVSKCIAFGHYRLIETALCNYHSVSRTVGREVLQRLREQELIEKSIQSHWLAGPVTATAVVQEYELRILLEPAALIESAPFIKRDRLVQMQQNLLYFLDNPDQRTFESVRQLERELHHECLQHASNKKLLGILSHCRLPLAINQVFYETLENTTNQPLFYEHKLVIDHLLAGSVEAAAGALEAHLRSASRRTRARLKVLSVFPEPKLPPYLVKIV